MPLLPTLVMTTPEGKIGLDAGHVLDIRHREEYFINLADLPAPYLGHISYKGKPLLVRRADNSLASIDRYDRLVITGDAGEANTAWLVESVLGVLVDKASTGPLGLMKSTVNFGGEDLPILFEQN